MGRLENRRLQKFAGGFVNQRSAPPNEPRYASLPNIMQAKRKKADRRDDGRSSSASITTDAAGELKVRG